MKTTTNRQRKYIKAMFITTMLLGLVVISVVAYIRYDYQRNLRPVSASQQVVVITIPLGSSVQDISKILFDAQLIKQRRAFEWYIRNEDLRSKLQAGTYALSPSQSTQEIAAIIAKGEVKKELLTILPGKRLDQIRAQFINSGYKPEEVDAALNPDNYAGHPALVDKPKNASLEGYLYPDSFQKTASTTPQQIIKASLDEMSKRLTPEFRSAVAKQRLSVYEGIILASIIEKEVSNGADKKTVAQVFLTRLKQDMLLGSDVTAIYGSLKANGSASIQLDTPYNTHIYKGLPPGPISNVSQSSLEAIITPSATDYLFFVAGDDGVTYFSKTLKEHEELTRLHCKKLCQ